MEARDDVRMGDRGTGPHQPRADRRASGDAACRVSRGWAHDWLVASEARRSSVGALDLAELPWRGNYGPFDAGPPGPAAASRRRLSVEGGRSGAPDPGFVRTAMDCR